MSAYKYGKAKREKQMAARAASEKKRLTCESCGGEITERFVKPRRRGATPYFHRICLGCGIEERA